MADPGEGPGGPGPLIFRPNGGPKLIFWRPGSPLIPESGRPPPPPPLISTSGSDTVKGIKAMSRGISWGGRNKR